MAESRADTVRSYLGCVDAVAKRCARGVGRLHASPESMVLEVGQAFRPHPYPRSWRRGPKGQCFSNALDLLRAHPFGLRYAEGFAFSGDVVTMHGWCVSLRGRVYDPTWDAPEAGEYLGIIIPWDDLVARLDRAGQTLPLLLHDPLALRGGWVA